ncbi:hypothetical protein Tco_1459770 [Tanacetum coccineum]
MVKDICRNNQRSGNQGRNGVKIINMIREGGNRKRPFEEGRSGLTDELTFPVKTQKMQSSDGRFLGETYHPLGVIDLLVTMGRAGRSKMVLMEFAIIKCRSPFNVIIRRTEMRNASGAVQNLMWVVNTIPVNLGNGAWKVQVNYSSHNKVCAKDMYLFLEEEEGLASIMGYLYRFFLRLLKEYSQIRMTKDDE